MNWHSSFNERQVAEINFSKDYAKNWNHGTDGHNAKLIIAKMATLLDQIEAWANDELYREQWGMPSESMTTLLKIAKIELPDGYLETDKFWQEFRKHGETWGLEKRWMSKER